MNADILFHLSALKKSRESTNWNLKERGAGQRALLKPGEFHDSKLISVKLIFLNSVVLNLRQTKISRCEDS